MTDRNFANSRFADLYRRCTRTGSTEPLPDVDALLALSDGEHSPSADRLVANAARSGVHADLIRFTRALAPESARLGSRLEHAFEATVAPAHRRAAHAARRAAPRHGAMRLVASLAAGLVVAVAVWGLQQRQSGPPPIDRSAALLQLKADRIFVAADKPANGRGGDVIFRAPFAPDQIFKAKFSGG